MQAMMLGSSKRGDLGCQHRSPFWDTVLLVTASLLVCAVSVAAYWAADTYHVGAQWIFFGLNVIGFAAVVGRKFRLHWDNPRFIVFLLLWAAIHAGLIITVGNNIETIYWLPIFGGELFVGYFVAFLVFGLPNESK
jgi:FtsH-binding integral membrane protein